MLLTLTLYHATFDRFARCRTVKLVHRSFHTVDVTVRSLRIRVSESGSLANLSRCPKVSLCILVEWFEWRIGIEIISLPDRGSSEPGLRWTDIGIGVERLPNGKEAIDIYMMQPENWIKRRVFNLSAFKY